MLFTNKEISALENITQRTIRKVVYYYWTTDVDYKCLDYIELIFSDGEKIVFARGEDSDGVEIITDFDPQVRCKEIEQKFGSQITLIRENVTIDPLWLPTVELPLKEIKLNEENHSHFSRHFVILIFSDDHQVEISIAEEGMSVDFYENI